MPKPMLTGMKVAHLLEALEDIAPSHLAEEWDNVGLLVGDKSADAGRVLVTLEVTPAVLAEAAKRKASTIVAHHPLIFRGMKRLLDSDPIDALVIAAVRARLNVLCAHTNLDMVRDGTNGEMADRLGLGQRTFLLPHEGTHSVKYAVFVPATHVEAVIGAIASAGAGVIGDYSHCTFRTPGTGTYLPLAGASPYAGRVGKLEEATDEVKLECLCPKQKLPALLAAVRAVHPYEEIAFDVFPLEPAGTPRHGLGLVGDVSKPIALGEFADQCKQAFGVSSVGVVGDARRPVRRVAVCSGSGGEALRKWKPGTADVLVTGEMTHHQCARARDLGIGAILVGHHASEVVVAPRLAARLAEHPVLRPFKPQVLVAKNDVAPLARR